jgi:CRP-like cAMP-binding protein
MSLIREGVVSSAIYFIQEGQVQVYSRQIEHPLIMFDEGSYIGDISFIYGIRNHYRYIPTQPINRVKIFNLQKEYLNNIFDSFPEFKNVLKIRALRR